MITRASNRAQGCARGSRSHISSMSGPRLSSGVHTSEFHWPLRGRSRRMSIFVCGTANPPLHMGCHALAPSDIIVLAYIVGSCCPPLPSAAITDWPGPFYSTAMYASGVTFRACKYGQPFAGIPGLQSGGDNPTVAPRRAGVRANSMRSGENDDGGDEGRSAAAASHAGHTSSALLAAAAGVRQVWGNRNVTRGGCVAI